MGRVTEWSIVVRDNCRNVYMVAEAQYARGARPTETEIDALDKRIRQKHPFAEFTKMQRGFVQSTRRVPNLVWWQLEWCIYED